MMPTASCYAKGADVLFCVLKDSFVAKRKKSERLQPEAPSGRELSAKLTEGESVTIKQIEI